MAQLQVTIVTGSLKLPQVENTSFAGNMWYNPDNNKIEYSYWGSSYPGVWSTGSPINNAGGNFASTGTQNAALAAGGEGRPENSTEEYNGDSWVNVSPLIQGRRYTSGIGTQNSTIVMGGFSINNDLTNSECYDGTSWITSTPIPQFKSQTGKAGDNSSSTIIFGGSPSNNSSWEWNGSSWSSGGILNSGRKQLSGFGSQNAALAVGGSYQLNCTEEYDGISWSIATNAMNTSRFDFTATGTQNLGFVIGGYIYKANTEEYDGTTWSTGGNLSCGRGRLGSGGSNEGLVAFGGMLGGASCTEEYKPAPSIITCTL